MLSSRTVFVIKILFCMFMNTPICADEVLDFGRVRIGSSQLDTLTLKNESLVPLMITNITTNHTQFATPAWGLTHDMIRVEAGRNWAYPVVFSPTDTGQIETHLNVVTDTGSWGWLLKGEGAQEVVVINEVLADPAPGDKGDANKDGVRNSNQDEFVELVNTGNYGIDVSGWQLFDQGTLQSKRFTFPNGTRIAPQEHIVVFGGGDVAGIDGQVFVDDGKIGGGLRNSGDAVYLVDQTGQDTLARMDYGNEGGKNQSLVRWPEGTGLWSGHEVFPGKGLPHSPGRARTVVQEIHITRQSGSVAVGDTLQFSVEEIFSDKSIQEGDVKELALAISDTSILTPLSDGKWLARHIGNVEVLGEYKELYADTLTLNVMGPRLVGLLADVQDTLLLVGDEAEIIVRGVDTQGLEAHIANGFDVQTDDSGALLVHSSQVLAQRQGNGRVTVSYQGLQAHVNLRVVELGDLNGDGNHTLWDAVRTVYLILGIAPKGTDFERRAADLVSDSVLDIQDLIAVLQLVLGGPVSRKPVSGHLSIGWQAVPEGIALYLPPQTGVIHFEMPLVEDVLTLETVFGQVFVQHTDGKLTGMIMAGGVEAIAPKSILVKGLPPRLVPSWTAWTLAGVAYPLNELESVKKPLELVRVFPNPANPETTIDFVVPFDQGVSLDVHAVTGQWICQLWQGPLRSGNHHVIWDGRDAVGNHVASGVYFLHLRGLINQATLKMVILR